MPKHALVTRHSLHVCMWVCYVRMSANGNQVLLCSAKTGLLLHRQLGVSRSSLTSSAGPLTSNTPLMADKLIGLGQAGQQMGTFTFKAGQQNLSVLLRPSIQNPGQLFSWDVKRKRLSGLWESNKMSNPWLVTAAACLKKREKKDLCEVRNDKGRWKETSWCDVITFLQELSQTRGRDSTGGVKKQRAYQDITTGWSAVIYLIWKREYILNRCCGSFAGC